MNQRELLMMLELITDRLQVKRSTNFASHVRIFITRINRRTYTSIVDIGFEHVISINKASTNET